MDVQKTIAGVSLAIVFIGMSGVLGWQILHGVQLDPLVGTAWGVLAGQYVKLLGVEQGTSVIAKALNGKSTGPLTQTNPPDSTGGH